jgi:uncharacterized protein (TIGR02118 family)
MYKLVILIQAMDERQEFDVKWPDFLHQVEAMPGLVREASSRVVDFLYGEINYMQMHELYFNSYADLREAMTSPQGKMAGALLQQMTQGKMTLFIAEHKEDDLDNIRAHTSSDDRKK